MTQLRNLAGVAITAAVLVGCGPSSPSAEDDRAFDEYRQAIVSDARDTFPSRSDAAAIASAGAEFARMSEEAELYDHPGADNLATQLHTCALMMSFASMAAYEGDTDDSSFTSCQQGLSHALAYPDLSISKVEGR